jgi:hypothetical protein
MAICPSSRGLPGPETAEELGTGAEPPRRPPLRSGYVRVPTSRPTAFSVGVAVGLHALLVAAVTFVPVHRSSAPIRPHPLVEAVTYLTVQDWLPRASPGTPPVPSTQATGAGAVLGAPAAGQGAVVPDSFHSGAGDPGADAVPAHELHDARLGEPEVQRRSSRLGPELWDHRLVVPPDRQGTRTPVQPNAKVQPHAAPTQLAERERAIRDRRANRAWRRMSAATHHVRRDYSTR